MDWDSTARHGTERGGAEQNKAHARILHDLQASTHAHTRAHARMHVRTHERTPAFCNARVGSHSDR
eukprot:14973868-Alexandrium_andersonii.AAC.1